MHSHSNHYNWQIIQLLLKIENKDPHIVHVFIYALSLNFNLYHHWSSYSCLGLGDFEGIVPQKQHLYKLQQYLNGVNYRVGQPCCGPGLAKLVSSTHLGHMPHM